MVSVLGRVSMGERYKIQLALKYCKAKLRNAEKLVFSLLLAIIYLLCCHYNTM